MAVKILMTGPFFHEDLVEERGLPARNAAAYNRMLRLGRSLKAAEVSVVLLSGAITARPLGRARFHRADFRRVQGIPVVTTCAIGVRYVGALIEPIIVAFAASRICLRHGIALVSVYNTSPVSVAVALACRLLGIKVLADIEDVSFPRLADFRSGSDIRAGQQVVYWLGLMFLRALAHGFLTPTLRFGRFLHCKKPLLAVGAVNEFGEVSPAYSVYRRGQRPLRVLFCGKWSAEFGSALLLDALKILDSDPDRLDIHVDIVGQSSADFAAPAYETISVRWRGFLPDVEYAAVLREADVGISLQRSDGRNAEFKVPSKVYEFITAGKLVISTRIADLAELQDLVVFLSEETPVALAVEIKRATLMQTAMRDRVNLCALAAERWRPQHVGRRIKEFLIQWAC